MYKICNDFALFCDKNEKELTPKCIITLIAKCTIMKAIYTILLTFSLGLSSDSSYDVMAQQ